MFTPTRQMGVALLLMVAALSSGCGGSATQATPFDTNVTSKPPPSNVPEAIAELDQAEAAVDRAIGAPPSAEELKKAEAAQASPTSSPAAPPTPTEAAGGAAPDRAGAPASAQDPCVTACRALASMGRSVEHVCGLAGEQDPQCTNARERVGRAADRVRAHCPICS